MKTPKLTPILLALATSGLALTAQAEGTIQFATGTVTVVNAQGESRLVTRGAAFAQGETISTGSSSRAQLRFTDGALVSLQPNTDFRVDQYRFDGRPNGQEKGFFNLLKGGIRTITGMIGRQNRDAYKVDTPVATIGIRGTEYTAQLDVSAEDLLVHTGEGLVEVCNTAGCILLASGETGRVSSSSEPRRTETRPQLPPAQPNETTGAEFSVSENRGDSGGILPVGPTLPSGSGYTIAVAGPAMSDGANLVSGQDAKFSSSGELLSRSDSDSSTTMTASAGSMTLDGVLAWGRWLSSVDIEDVGATPETEYNTHYIIGKPTSSADLAALSGTSLNYQLAGYTLPTTGSGTTGQVTGGSLNLSFSGGYVTSDLNLNIAISGNSYSLSGSGSGYGSSFSGSGSNGLSYEGFVAGSNASHAGLSYTFDASGADVYGTAAFKK